MDGEILIRAGTSDDSPGIYRVFVAAFVDLNRRLNLETGFVRPDFVEWFWQRHRPLFDYLARTDSRFAVAEADGQVVGFARSILRDGVLQLTEFFVHPQAQAAGVGRELLGRVFPREEAARKLIIATLDSRAQVRYLKSGVYPRCPLQYFSRKPEAVAYASDLSFLRVVADAQTVAQLDAIDRAVLGYARGHEHHFLLADREGYLIQRGGESVGYAYLGSETGPIALLDPADFPAVLAYAEQMAAAQAAQRIGVEVPMINRHAVDYLLGRGFRLEPFMALLMSDEPFGSFDCYIGTSPPWFI